MDIRILAKFAALYCAVCQLCACASVERGAPQISQHQLVVALNSLKNSDGLTAEITIGRVETMSISGGEMLAAGICVVTNPRYVAELAGAVSELRIVTPGVEHVPRETALYVIFRRSGMIVFGVWFPPFDPYDSVTPGRVDTRVAMFSSEPVRKLYQFSERADGAEQRHICSEVR